MMWATNQENIATVYQITPKYLKCTCKGTQHPNIYKILVIKFKCLTQYSCRSKNIKNLTPFK